VRVNEALDELQTAPEFGAEGLVDLSGRGIVAPAHPIRPGIPEQGRFRMARGEDGKDEVFSDLG
jgi:hypothetical protein